MRAHTFGYLLGYRGLEPMLSSLRPTVNTIPSLAAALATIIYMYLWALKGVIMMEWKCFDNLTLIANQPDNKLPAKIMFIISTYSVQKKKQRMKMIWELYYFVQVQLTTEVPCTPSLTWPRFELLTSRRNHDSTFHVTETPALITWPSVSAFSY